MSTLPPPITAWRRRVWVLEGIATVFMVLGVACVIATHLLNEDAHIPGDAGDSLVVLAICDAVNIIGGAFDVLTIGTLIAVLFVARAGGKELDRLIAAGDDLVEVDRIAAVLQQAGATLSNIGERAVAVDRTRAETEAELEHNQALLSVTREQISALRQELSVDARKWNRTNLVLWVVGVAITVLLGVLALVLA